MSIKHSVINTIKRVSAAAREKEIKAIITPADNKSILLGKNALIVGGGGIGCSIAKSLCNAGCNVIITGRNEEKIQRQAKLINENVTGVVLDVTDVPNISNTIFEIISKFEEHKIDILVNSAGVASSVDFFKVTEEEWDRIMDTNLKGMFFVSQAVSSYMIQNGLKGHILNISSAASLRPAWRPYQISKWAVNGFTKGLADTLLPYGIIVNGIAPGPVATAMLGKTEDDSIFNPSNPSGRYALPEEIANLALFLVSPMGDFVVGETYVISGGAGTLTYHN